MTQNLDSLPGGVLMILGVVALIQVGPLGRRQILDSPNPLRRLHERETDMGPSNAFRENVADFGLQGTAMLLGLSSKLLLNGLLEPPDNDGCHRCHLLTWYH